MSPDNRGRRNSEEETRHSSDPDLIHILVLVKAAPLPSTKYLETMCAAGINRNGYWYRLYPIPYRYLTSDKQFAKYQWIEVKVSPVDESKDSRKESRRPHLNTLTTLGKPLPAGKALERRQFILFSHTLINQLNL